MSSMQEHFSEIEATLKGAHSIMEQLSAMERRVGPLGSHGYTHKITKALAHLAELRAAVTGQAAPTVSSSDDYNFKPSKDIA
jgi:hypothetical protein